MKLEQELILSLGRKCLRGKELKVFSEAISGKGLTEISKGMNMTVESIRLIRLRSAEIFRDYVDDILHIEYVQEAKTKLESELKALRTLRGKDNLHPKMVEALSQQEFSERTTNVLRDALPTGTVADLVSLVNRKGYNYMLGLKNCGKKTVDEIKEFIEFNGL